MAMIEMGDGGVELISELAAKAAARKACRALAVRHRVKGRRLDALLGTVTPLFEAARWCRHAQPRDAALQPELHGRLDSARVVERSDGDFNAGLGEIFEEELRAAIAAEVPHTPRRRSESSRSSAEQLEARWREHGARLQRRAAAAPTDRTVTQKRNAWIARHSVPDLATIAASIPLIVFAAR